MAGWIVLAVVAAGFYLFGPAMLTLIGLALLGAFLGDLSISVAGAEQ